MSDETAQATPPENLREQILSPSVAKNEREWWASKEIQRLQKELAEALSSGKGAHGAWQLWLQRAKAAEKGLADIKMGEDSLRSTLEEEKGNTKSAIRLLDIAAKKSDSLRRELSTLIECLENPTAEMIEAGLAVFKAMIDEAKEGK